MSSIDLEYLRQWLGKTQVDNDVASSRQARLMAVTLDMDPDAFVSGTPLPPLWHWIYFLSGSRPKDLGPDGHAARGLFLPPVPLPNRMWAGGRVSFKRALPLDASIEKRSTVLDIKHKQGRTGDLVFVTVQHAIFVDGELAIEEQHDIVYKGREQGKSAPPTPPSGKADCVLEFTPTSTTLFRYSALTFNGHRIHYDLDYCRNVENYKNLVIHGPLNATLLAGLAHKLFGKDALRSFDYRGLQPTILGQTLTLNAKRSDSGLDLWAALSDGSASMVAQARI